MISHVAVDPVRTRRSIVRAELLALVGAAAAASRCRRIHSSIHRRMSGAGILLDDEFRVSEAAAAQPLARTREDANDLSRKGS
jgi:hypothetical protein